MLKIQYTGHSVTAQSIVPFYERKAMKENVTLNSVETSYIYLVLVELKLGRSPVQFISN